MGTCMPASLLTGTPLYCLGILDRFGHSKVTSGNGVSHEPRGPRILPKLTHNTIMSGLGQWHQVSPAALNFSARFSAPRQIRHRPPGLFACGLAKTKTLTSRLCMGQHYCAATADRRAWDQHSLKQLNCLVKFTVHNCFTKANGLGKAK